MNWKIIFNPFEKLDEKILLVIGIVGFILTVFLSFIYKCPIYSIYKLGFDDNLTLQNAFFYVAISFSVAILILSIFAKIGNKNSRIIDVINSVLISQIPVLFLMLIANLPTLKKIAEATTRNINTPENIKIETTDLLIISFVAFVSLWILTNSIVFIV